MTQFTSAIYKGKVNHRRYTPKFHSFNYSYCMWLVDIDELDSVCSSYRLVGASKLNPVSIRLADHIEGVNDPIEFKARINQKVTELGGHWQGDKLLMMTQARVLGLYFSPVNFHFCYDGEVCRYMLAEVSNTPWGEKHWYLVDLANPRTEKDFHVSPFMPIEQEYRWRVKLPAKQFLAHIENWHNNKVFDATLTLKRENLSYASLGKTLLRFPVIALSTVGAIYWQAAKMFAKGFKFYSYQKRSR